MATDASTASTVDVDLDNFTDLFGTEDVRTPADAPTGTTIFSVPASEVDALLTPEAIAAGRAESAAEQLADAEAAAILDGLDDDVKDLPADETARAGRPKTDKSGLVDTIGKLISAGTLFGFDDDKPLEEYTTKDFEELIELNIKTKVDDVKAATPKEFYDSLPEELQYAAKYVNDGGTDIKSLFRVLGEVEEMRALDPAKPTDQAQIMRSYLQASNNRMSAADIEEEIADAAAAGTLAKKALKFKPELDGMQQEQVEAKLAQAETQKLQNKANHDAYLKNVHTELVTGKLGEVAIDKKRQQVLWDNLTQNNFQNRQGRPTNKLNHLLEDAYFGETPKMGLLAEVSWLLEDRAGYLAHMAQARVNETVVETAKKLKTTQAQKTASTPADDDPEPERRRIARPAANIFRR